nr:outer membrane beta-barrel protein [Methylonatrum kenyense]
MDRKTTQCGLLVVTLACCGALGSAQAQQYLTPEFESFGGDSLSEPHRYSSGFDDFRSDQFRDDDHWRISGGLRVNPFVSLELGYQDLGARGAREPGGDDMAGWSFSGLLSMPLSSGLAPYARIGQMFWDESGSSPRSVSGRRDSRELYYGIGLRFGLAEQLDMRFEYERYELDESELDIGTMNLQFSF